MQNLPPPMVPSEVDLTDFEFMPLDVRRLRDSRISAIVTGEEFRSAVLLWCAAWHQRPGGSLPDDDVELAFLAGFGRVVSAWHDVKAGALHGWVKCSDGRLYHPVIAEKAIEGWTSKLAHKWRKECDRTRKENKTREAEGKPALAMPARPAEIQAVETKLGSNAVSIVTDDVSAGNSDLEAGTVEPSAGIPAENALKGQGQGQGQGESKVIRPKPDKPVRTRTAYSDQFEGFWARYPTDKLMSKQETWKVWSKLTEDDRASAIAAIPGFVAYCRTDTTYRPVHAVRFLSQRRFDGFALQLNTTGSAPREDDPKIEFGGGWSSALSVAVKAFNDGKWLNEWGPRPGEPGCRVRERFWPAFGVMPDQQPNGAAAATISAPNVRLERAAAAWFDLSTLPT